MFPHAAIWNGEADVFRFQTFGVHPLIFFNFASEDVHGKNVITQAMPRDNIVSDEYPDMSGIRLQILGCEIHTGFKLASLFVLL